MTELMDGSEKESDPAASEPAADDVAEADRATGNGPGTAWVTPKARDGGGGLARGCVITLLVVALVVLGGLVSLIFLGTQVATRLEGTIELGTGGTGCSVTGAATTFPATTAFHFAAHLEREVPAGETVTSIVTYPNGTTESHDQTFDQVGRCVTEDVEPGLAPGHYVLEYRSGTEVLAKGAFDITP